MNAELTSQQLLTQIAQIQRMERGKLCVLRHGPNGPYYHLQSWEKGKNLNRYVPRDQLADYQEAIAGYQKFQQLTEQYAQQVIAQTRVDLAASKKKTRSGPSSSGPKNRKSKR